jgi:hypothetical protein
MMGSTFAAQRAASALVAPYRDAANVIEPRVA